MNAVVIAVGDELVTGQTVDTNSAHLAMELSRLGVSAVEHRTVGDCGRDIRAAIERAAGAADVVVVSGGLGPTADDVTRQALADAMGAELVLHEPSLRRIEEFFRARGRVMQPTNRIQAMVPAGAEPLENSLGTAPGIAARVGKALVFVVPGVPSEMRRMFENQVSPRLPRGEGTTVYRVIHSFGRGESDVASLIADLMERGREPAVGTTVAAGMVSVRIVSRGADRNVAAGRAGEVAAEVRRRLGDLVVGEDGDAKDAMAAAVGDLLRRRRQTLATAESCTGGLVGELVTAIPGSSDYYVGGVVAYANRIKHRMLGVPDLAISRHGAVSEPVAAAMAEGCRKAFGADWAVSTTGIAGPAGGSEEKPVGLVYIGLAGHRGVHVNRDVFPGTREIVRLRASLTALNLLRLALLQ